MASVVLGHLIEDRKEFSFFNLLDNFKLNFTLSVSFFFAFLGILAASFLFNEAVRRIGPEGRGRIEISKRILTAVSSLGENRFTAIGVFVLFVQIFIWITQLFLTNNIKTNKVVVDTSDLIKDSHDIFSTKRVACFMDQELLSSMIMSSHTQNILSKIYFEKTRLRPEMVEVRNALQSDNCFLPKDTQVFQRVASPEFFIVGESTVGKALFVIPGLIIGLRNKIWFNQKPIFEYNLVIYHHKNKPELSETIQRHGEAGMVDQMYRCIDNAARESIRHDKATVFQTTEEYVEEFAGFSNLILPNFRFIFFYYFLICSLIFLAFCMHHLVNWCGKEVQRRIRMSRQLWIQVVDRLQSIWTATLRVIELLKPSGRGCTTNRIEPTQDGVN